MTPGFSKLSTGALCNKDQRVGLDEYSPVVTCFLSLGQYLGQLWQAKRQVSEKNRRFSTSQGITDAAIEALGKTHLPPYLLVNLQHFKHK